MKSNVQKLKFNIVKRESDHLKHYIYVDNGL